jgi:TonB family protein
MERDGRDYVSMRTPGAARAVTALRACNDDLLRSWGIDMALRATLIRKPRAISGVINDTDYPLEARRNEQSGVTVINFIINVDGTLSDCRTAVSSGWPVLDAAACQLMTARFRYQPALGADGRAVAIREVRTITWLYPD